MGESVKPRWVECADKASEVLEAARAVDDSTAKDAIVREANAWMQLAWLYRGNEPLQPQ